MVVRVRDGKGGKDRYVPLGQRPLELLRAYWVVERPGLWLFPASQPHRHLAKSVVQKAFKSALSESGISKNASVHTLRHSYATHLLERGVNLHLIQQTLGHKSPRTTTVYMHLTQKALEGLQADINELMVDL
jgi:site-specific recombinase XerD